MIDEALSLLVDGEVIQEAIVIDSEGNVLCYPCAIRYSEHELRDMYSAVIELLSFRFISEKHGFAILYLSNVNLIIMPLPYRKVLILAVNSKYNAELVGRDYIKVLRKLLELTHLT